ncbi:Transposase [Methanocella conradii HZ254]|uniref:Transposase n=1 Tax=Methanocella conradii (strain DSM 24694 / JCM 17849 / CGMCC 1.5162 / HZ254) TaxID=1041930 RepID=H8I5A9_METCZ|nr:zinc ribbon domain-containing protein [Methanocella conradii]AFC98803.1 Transposase [Methanocella conradii HZ254]
MLRSYRYRFYPSTEVRNNIDVALNYCRFTYNKLLELYRNGKIKTVYDACNYVATLKQQYPELKTVYSKTLQRAGNHLFNNIMVLASLKNKGFKTGGLRYKNEYRFRTLEYNQSGFKITENLLELSKIGTVKLILHRPLPEGRIKSIFLSKLAYKAESAGRVLVRVDPRETSQKCYCGNIVKKDLSDRVHDCPCCGVSLDRDFNSALNILKKGLELLSGREGREPPGLPVEPAVNRDHQVSKPLA